MEVLFHFYFEICKFIWGVCRIQHMYLGGQCRQCFGIQAGPEHSQLTHTPSLTGLYLNFACKKKNHVFSFFFSLR